MFNRDGLQNDPPHSLKSTVEIWEEKRVLGHYLGKFANEMVKWCFGLFYFFLPYFY
jgi:hypothetical protein